jgi:membrane-associated phospholipid phosphatase
VDRWLILYNLGFAVLWLTAIGRVSFAPVIVLAHLAAAVLPALMTRLTPQATRIGPVLRQIYPLILIVGFWTEMGLVRDVFHATTYDAAVAAIDRSLLGFHLQTRWMPAMPAVWFSETMFFLYVLYYPMVFLTPVVLALRGNAATRNVVFRLTLGYTVCYVLYAMFPVDGPSHTMVRFDGALTEGFFYQFSAGAIHAGDSMGTAFPSSHVVGAVIMALLAFRWFARPLAALFVFEAIGVVVSAVYTQNHFAIDVVAGILLAVVVYSLVAPTLEALLTRADRRESVPPLPVYGPAQWDDVPTRE